MLLSINGPDILFEVQYFRKVTEYDFWGTVGVECTGFIPGLMGKVGFVQAATAEISLRKNL